MSFTWSHQCYECGRPTNVLFEDDDDELMFAHAVKFFGQYPLELYYNDEFLKFYGLKVKRVCRHCFYYRVRFNPLIQRDREMGLKVKMLRKSYTKTSGQIENWNRLFKQYLKNCI